ncbi:MAG TPA: polyphenol oxidase family protein [Longimicrobiales bacterium]|nr:polyphenol oxidase family protein [Longimicrobiales bacterium]
MVAEVPGDHGLYVHPAWAAATPSVIQGTTAGGVDMSLFGVAPVGEVIGRWVRLREALGCRAIVHARQVHGGDVLLHGELPQGLVLAPDADGHVTTVPAIALAVSVADCVPVFVAAPDRRGVCLLHAGWRSAAAGILEAGIARLARAAACMPADLLIHLGPAICGACYEVGPDVAEDLGVAVAARSASDDGPERVHLDLRAVLASRALACGVPARRVTVSAHCTRCGGDVFYSHRAGCRERQIAILGLSAAAM